MSQEDIEFNVSQEDLLEGTVLKPGPYLLEIKAVSQNPGKNNPQTTTTNLVFEVKSGPDLRCPGVIIKYYLNNAEGIPRRKAMDFYAHLYGKEIDKPMNMKQKADQMIGRKIKAYVVNEKFNGLMQNKIDGFLPA